MKRHRKRPLRKKRYVYRRPEANTERYDKWRKKVYTRDHFKCVICKTPRKIQAHHLDGWSWAIDKRYLTNNGVTLCSYHHFAFHKFCGKYKITRAKFNVFIQTKFNKRLSEIL